MGRANGTDLTKAVITALETKGKLYRVPDSQVRGLEIQVSKAGAKSWTLRYRVRGVQRMQTLGRWPEMTVTAARRRARIVLGDVADGSDPVAEAKAERAAETVSVVAAQFELEHMATLKPSTRLEYARLLKKWILPALGSLKAKDVQSSDVAALLSKIRCATPKGIEANRVRAVLSKMFSLASVWGQRANLPNPAQGQVRAVETKKDRHLSDRELLALGSALRHLAPTPLGETRPETALPEENMFGLAALRLILLTGMRKSEIIGSHSSNEEKSRNIPGLAWKDVDLEIGTIRMEVHKTSRRKGTRVLTLCADAIALLESLPRMVGNDYVIPGNRKGQSLVGLQKIWERVRDAVPTIQERAGVQKTERANLSGVTLHDLRRSFASLAARMGYSELVAAALLGHSAGTVTQGYARLGADPLRDVVNVIGARMAALLDGQVDLEAEARGRKAKPSGA